MSPAIQLGADKILVIGLHHTSERAEQGEFETFVDNDKPPTMGEIIGQLLKTLFVDRLEYDVEQLNRINRVINYAENIYGADFVKKINDYVAQQRLRQDFEARGIKKLKMMSIFPSMDIRKIFSDSIYNMESVNKLMSTMEKSLLKIMDVDLAHGKDFLSFILFAPAYISKMMELGFEDARAHHDKLIEFFLS